LKNGNSTIPTPTSIFSSCSSYNLCCPFSFTSISLCSYSRHYLTYPHCCSSSPSSVNLRRPLARCTLKQKFDSEYQSHQQTVITRTASINTARPLCRNLLRTGRTCLTGTQAIVSISCLRLGAHCQTRICSEAKSPGFVESGSWIISNASGRIRHTKFRNFDAIQLLEWMDWYSLFLTA
jgi:hypothetical protein